jgi:D-aspartate ligase
VEINRSAIKRTNGESGKTGAAASLRSEPNASQRFANGRGALVLGGDASALAIVRSLGRHKIPVWTLAGKDKLAGFSRYCVRSLRWPESDEPEQLEYLLNLADQYQLDGWVLFAIDDERAALLARNRHLLGARYRVPPPDWETMRWAYDKRRTYELAGKLGLSHPFTLCPRNRADVAAWAHDFPVILKPAFKRGRNRFTHAKAWMARDRVELLRLFDEASTLVDPAVIVVQEMVSGGGQNQYSYAGLHANGDAIASLVVRRTRQHPSDFGIASFVETVESDEVDKRAKALLRAINYSGLVEIEFKYDPRDGTYKLLDFNSRIWFWHALAARAGIDFPYLMWRWMQDGSVDDCGMRRHAKWIHTRRDLPAAWNDLWHRRCSIPTYLRSLAGTSQFAVMATDDPLPALLELPALVVAKWFS